MKKISEMTPHGSPAFNERLARLKRVVAEAPGRAGVYEMLNEQQQVLYVGKANHLRRRLSSYFGSRGLSSRIIHMIHQVHDIRYTVTQNDAGALLLESKRIKSCKPRYNIVLQDDKSYPYIMMSDHRYPEIRFYRGRRRKGKQYFGPYPSAKSVRATLSEIQKMFQLRSCRDSVFNHRSRPCLLHQIGRCSAPCVGKISAENYAIDVQQAQRFLQGQDRRLLEEIAERMEQAAESWDYERAAQFRDRLTAMRMITSKTDDEIHHIHCDILGMYAHNGQACIARMMIRSGRHLGTQSVFLKAQQDQAAGDILRAFMVQFYHEEDSLPEEIVVPKAVTRGVELERLLGAYHQRKVSILQSVRQRRKQWLLQAQANAELALKQQQLRKGTYGIQFESLRLALGLPTIERIECVDVSHSLGEATWASRVVFQHSGADKAAYRRIKVTQQLPSDDYAAVAFLLKWRLRQKEPIEVLIIDGGAGQLNAAWQCIRLNEQQSSVKSFSGTLIAISKGPERKVGEERLWRGQPPRCFTLPNPAFKLLQSIRDEAHRFAISGHRRARLRARVTSDLEQIPGLGKAKVRALLHQMGGMQEIKKASVQELCEVPGISETLAKRVFDAIQETESHAGLLV